MISREEYLKALHTVHKYKKQCKNDLRDIEIAESSLILFKDVASPRLQNVIKASFSIPQGHELTVNELRTVINKVGMDNFKSVKGLGQKTLDELERILF